MEREKGGVWGCGGSRERIEVENKEKEMGGEVLCEGKGTE